LAVTVIDAGSNEVGASTSTWTASVSTLAFHTLAFQAFGAHHFNAVNGAPVHFAPRPSLNVNSGGGGSLEPPVSQRMVVRVVEQCKQAGGR
jgi:hypothetical protein